MFGIDWPVWVALSVGVLLGGSGSGLFGKKAKKVAKTVTKYLPDAHVAFQVVERLAESNGWSSAEKAAEFAKKMTRTASEAGEELSRAELAEFAQVAANLAANKKAEAMLAQSHKDFTRLEQEARAMWRKWNPGLREPN